MKSTIRIEYDFDTKQPVLRIVQDKTSDDLRDQMLKSFIQEASFENSRLYVTYPEYLGRKDNHIVEIRCERNPPKKGYLVLDSSKAFRDFLADRSIQWKANEEYTEIFDEQDIFQLGIEWEKYKEENRPKSPAIE